MTDWTALSASFIDIVDRRVADTITAAQARDELAVILPAIGPDEWVQLQQAATLLGRIDNVLFVLSAPPNTLGGTGAVAFDLINKVVYGPKDETTGWPEGQTLSGLSAFQQAVVAGYEGTEEDFGEALLAVVAAVAAESARATAEAARALAETGRIAAESARVSAEEARDDAETERQADTAAVIATATGAADAAEEAMEMALDAAETVVGVVPSAKGPGLVILTASDNRKRLVVTGPATVQLDAGLPYAFAAKVTTTNGSPVEIMAGVGVTVDGPEELLTLETAFATAWIGQIATDAYVVEGGETASVGGIARPLFDRSRATSLLVPLFS